MRRLRIRRPHRQGHAVLHDAGHPRHLAQGLVRQHRARRHTRPAGGTSTRTAGSCSTSSPTAASATTWPPSSPRNSRNSRQLWFAEAEKYNGLPLADLNILETLGRWRPYLVGDRKTFTYYPDTAEVGIGAAVELRGQSFSVLAEVSRRRHRRRGRALQARRRARRACAVPAGRPAALHLQLHGRGGATGFVARAGPAGQPHARRRAMTRTGTVEGSHTPLGDVSLYVDGDRGGDQGRSADPSGQLRPGRRRRRGGPQHRSAGVGSPTGRRSRSPVAPSPRWSSTSPARPTSISNANWPRLSRRTDDGAVKRLHDSAGIGAAGAVALVLRLRPHHQRQASDAARRAADDRNPPHRVDRRNPRGRGLPAALASCRPRSTGPGGHRHL